MGEDTLHHFFSAAFGAFLASAGLQSGAYDLFFIGFANWVDPHAGDRVANRLGAAYGTALFWSGGSATPSGVICASGICP
jgi:hypothetical protein